MPRRWHDEEEEEVEEEEDEDEDDFSNTKQETQDMRAAPGIPTLFEIRKHITEYAWNGGECLPSMDNELVFEGQCEYASTAISEILTGTGKNFKHVDWSLRIRGWYTGDLSAVKNHHACDPNAFTEDKHCHSWVEYGGKIIDATWWQFGGDEVRVYVFDLDDPRFIRDKNA